MTSDGYLPMAPTIINVAALHNTSRPPTSQGPLKSRGADPSSKKSVVWLHASATDSPLRVGRLRHGHCSIRRGTFTGEFLVRPGPYGLHETTSFVISVTSTATVRAPPVDQQGRTS